MKFDVTNLTSFVKIPFDVLIQPKIDSPTFIMFAVIRAHAWGETSICSCSQSTLAKEVGRSKREVTRLVGLCQSHELILVDRSWRINGLQSKNNIQIQPLKESSGFAILPFRVLYDRSLSPFSKRLFTYLNVKSDTHGEHRTTLGNLACIMRKSLTQVKQSLNALKTLGLIKTERTFRRSIDVSRDTIRFNGSFDYTQPGLKILIVGFCPITTVLSQSDSRFLSGPLSREYINTNTEYKINPNLKTVRSQKPTGLFVSSSFPLNKAKD